LRSGVKNPGKGEGRGWRYKWWERGGTSRPDKKKESLGRKKRDAVYRKRKQDGKAGGTNGRQNDMGKKEMANLKKKKTTTNPGSGERKEMA